MVKRIKKKYTFIVMSSIIAVLGLIITAINLTNYSSINELLDEKLTMLVENDGMIPEVSFGKPPEEDPPKTNNGDGGANSGEGGNQTGGSEGGGSDTDPDNTTDPTDPDDPNGGNNDTDGDNTETIPDDGESNEDKKEDNKKEESYTHMSPETPFELRFFSVKLDTYGGFLDVWRLLRRLYR